MSEQVTRHRGPTRDDDGKLVAATDTSLTAFEVAPGGSTRSSERARDDGLVIAHTVYFLEAVDLTNDDRLTVRGESWRIVVNEWTFGGFDGREVLCTRGQG